MAHFPQLISGASAQYPLRKTRVTRSVVNALGDGSMVRWQDPGHRHLRWELEMRGLTVREWGAIQSLFEASEGRLRRFTFCDPSDNLLAASEDFSATVWQPGPLLLIEGNVADPFAGQRAFRITNGGQTRAALAQPVNAPGDFQYCFSVFARALPAGQIYLRRATAGGSQAESLALTSAWRRVQSSGNLNTAESPIEFGVELDPGASCELFGAQVDAQPAPSAYRKTGSRGGVHPTARFEDDELSVVAEGSDNYSITVRIVAPVQD